MNNYAMLVKEKLISTIKDMAKTPMLFVKNAGKDFTRNRKLSFETVIHLLLSMGGNSLCKELLEYCGYDVGTACSTTR
jgi:hypothetical protein